MNWRDQFIEVDAGYVTPCLEWTGSRIPDGYGKVMIDGRLWLVHRLVWAEEYGDPLALHVLHKCDNPPCGRVDHLFMGTHSDNMQDAVRKGRLPRDGEHNGRAKLTEEDVRAIRSMVGISEKEIAARFGVTAATVGFIRRRVTWRNV